MMRVGLVGCVLALGCGPPPTETDFSYDERFPPATLRVFSPAQVSPGASRPAVMLVHGGGWKEGSKTQLFGVAQRLAAHGYVTASIGYRLGPAGAYPAAVQDVRCALAFLQNRAESLQMDPHRVAVLGHSAGGHLVSLLGAGWSHEETQPDCAEGLGPRPRAVISSSGPQDLRTMGHLQPVREFLGGSIDEIPARYTAASPITHVRRGLPPFLLLHGTGDLYVPPGQTSSMRDALVAAGNDARQVLVAGGGHVLNPGVSADQLTFETYILDSDEAFLAVVDFLRATVGPP